MNELLVNVSDFVLPLIIISAAFGGLCAFVAILGVKKETHRFARFCKDAHLSSEEVRFEGRKEKLKEQIERLSKNKKMARVGQGKLLQLRLETIKDAVEATGAKVMPSLHDMHSLSVQDEMSRFSSCWLRTVTSFLLIMGILGTLTGVHKVVSSGTLLNTGDLEESLRALGDALQPSMFAVFFTIVLMWFRGWYVACLDGYLEKLDLFTMTELIPFMQPVSNIQSKTTDLRSNLDELEKKVDELESLNKNMGDLKEHMYQYVQKAEADTLIIAQMKGKLEEVYKHLSEIKQKECERERDVKLLAQSGENEYSYFKAGVDTMSSYVNSVNERCAAVSEQYSLLVDNIETVVRDVQSGRETVEVMEEKAHNMNEMGKLVSEYDMMLHSMSDKMTHVNDAFEKVQKLKDKVVVSENLVNDSSIQAANMLKASSKIVQGISESNTDFRVAVDDGTRNVMSAIGELEDKLSELAKVEKELVAEWQGLSRKLAL